MRFRFIDRVIEFKRGEVSKLVTAKTFPESHEFNEGHPHRPGEVPTCLVIEALATSGVHLVFSHTSEQFLGVLLKVDVAEIFAPVYAGEEVVVHTELLAFQPKNRRDRWPGADTRRCLCRGSPRGQCAASTVMFSA